jgi:hypothetical protein
MHHILRLYSGGARKMLMGIPTSQKNVLKTKKNTTKRLNFQKA